MEKRWVLLTEICIFWQQEYFSPHTITASMLLPTRPHLHSIRPPPPLSMSQEERCKRWAIWQRDLLFYYWNLISRM
jgi:hypothetical protein